VCARPVENKCFGWKGNEREEDEFAVVKDAEIGNTPLSTRRSLLLRIKRDAPLTLNHNHYILLPRAHYTAAFNARLLRRILLFDEGMYLDGGTPESHSLEHLDSLITLDDCSGL